MKRNQTLSVLHPCVATVMLVTTILAIAPRAFAQSSTDCSSQHRIQSAAVGDETPQQIAEQFLELLADGRFEDARQYLNPVLASEWTADILEQRWNDAQRRTGPFIQHIASETVGDVVLVSAEFTQVSDNVVFIFDENERISGIDFPLQPNPNLNP